MTLREESMPATEEKRPLSGLEERLTRLLFIDGEQLAYIVLFILAVLTRFWDLGVRVMSHDESLHTRYSWNLYQGNGFQHTPLMHGPLLFHMTALSYLLFGDNDFTARIYPAVLGVILVMMPYFMRKWLGRLGALAASFFFLISPLILYYSRYIRHDIPAILAGVVIALMAWRYIEEREFKYLLWIGGAQAVMFASKEVAFIYIAIFGSFLTLYFISRLLDAEWESRTLYLIFGIAVIVTLLALVSLVVFTLLQQGGMGALADTGTVTPLDPSAAEAAALPSTIAPFNLPRTITLLVLALAVAVLFISVLVGQWRNLRRFPELDVMIVMGTLVLPLLTPFVMHSTRIIASKLVNLLAAPPDFLTPLTQLNPVDESDLGVQRSVNFTIPMLVISIVAGLLWGMKPPKTRRVSATTATAADSGSTVEVSPDITDWLRAFFTSRWLSIGALYWLIFIFFFTTMFTSGSGLGTGVIGSLGYWLEQQGVERGSQPGYYYIMVLLPIYEFLPVILSLAAGVIGLGSLIGGLFGRSAGDETPAQTGEEAGTSEEAQPLAELAASPPSPRPPLDLDAPIDFPVLLFIGYWALVNVFAYSYAGEKMPWLTTHLTTPMILLGGWVAGRLLERIDWRALWEKGTWLLFVLFPLLGITLLRVVAPGCARVPRNPLCNTIIPVKYQSPIFTGHTIAELSATYGWLAGLGVFFIALVVVITYARRTRPGQWARLISLCLVGWLTFLTARAAWRAAYVSYDDATEYLVYAHSAGAVKEVLDQIEEISLKTTDGYGLRVAYDNQVSWPYTWYLRDYYNAIFYGEQPSRGLIGDAPVLLAGPSNWNKVESLLGDRYYRFEYVRMWWPMQDYFNLKDKSPSEVLQIFRNVYNDPALQRGIWEIFYNRDYTTYGEAKGENFELSEWPVAEHMRFYVRKDVFAQVWDYGVAASEIAEAIDPYAEHQRELTPALTFGSGLLNQPHGLALGPDGLLYVADTQNHRVAVFDPDGNLVDSFGSYGPASQPDALNEPWDVAVGPDGNIYVADTWNHRVVKFSPQGRSLATWGVEGPNELSDPRAFWGPRGIVVDDEGYVYLADTGNKRVQVFDDQGNFERQIGSGGTLDGQLDEPVGLAIEGNQNLYVADTWNQRIQVFTLAGLALRQWPVEAWFAQTNERPYIAIDAGGSVYVTDPEAFRVIVFTGTGQYYYSFGDFNTIQLAGGLAVDDEGHLFLSDTGAGTIQRYDLGFVSLPAP